VQAYAWFSLAASQFPASEKENRDRAIKFRDQVGSKMTPAQREKATNLLAAPAMAQENTAVIELSKELQECSQYYFLLSMDLVLQVPQSGKLSPADSDKVGKGMVYKTQSEQIEVLVKNLALGSMTDEELTARGAAMYERIKRVMGPEWNMGRLHERYKAFCEYLLNRKGWKARLQDLEQGNVCGGLYKCW
jgi:hypothetical protein